MLRQDDEVEYFRLLEGRQDTFYNGSRGIILGKQMDGKWRVRWTHGQVKKFALGRYGTIDYAVLETNLILVQKELKYDPAQQGDTEDDI